MYRQYPALYAYNKVTKRHILKKSATFKKAYRENPTICMESSVMFPTGQPEINALAEAKEEPTPAPVVAELEPAAPVSVLEQKPANDMVA